MEAIVAGLVEARAALTDARDERLTELGDLDPNSWFPGVTQGEPLRRASSARRERAPARNQGLASSRLGNGTAGALDNAGRK